MPNYLLAIAATGLINDMSGTPIATGTITFQATDQFNNPVPVGIGGGGQATTKPVSFVITAGVIASGSKIVNPALSSPSPVYKVTIADTSVSPTQYTVYQRVLIADNGSAGWDFGLLATGTLLPQIPVTLVTGPIGATGSVANSYQGMYTPGTAYAAGTLTTWYGSLYLCTVAVPSSGSYYPDQTPAKWTRIVAGVNYFGAYNPAGVYPKYAMATYNGAAYLYLVESDGTYGHQPDTSTSYWGLLSAAGATGPTGATPASASAIFLTDTATGVINLVTVVNGNLTVAALVGGLPNGASTSAALYLLDSGSAVQRTITVVNGNLTVA